jgi:hypothetical protein
MSRDLRFFLAGLAIPVSMGMVALGGMWLLSWRGLWVKASGGLLLIGLGAGALIWAFTSLRGFVQIVPEALAVRIVRLARLFGGELALAQITAGLYVSEEDARAALALLVADGVCVAADAHDDRYLFPSMRPGRTA